MSTFRLGATLVVVGSATFLVGAAFGVPTVFTTAGRDERVRLLTRHMRRWQAAQVFYGGGPVLAAAGVGLGGLATDGAAGVPWTVAGAATVVGALAWAYSCLLRATDPVAFARGEQPGLPFRVYVILTLAGLASLGVALLMGDTPSWLGWTVLVADLGYAVLYAVSGDLPPFVFYVLLLVVGIAI